MGCGRNEWGERRQGCRWCVWPGLVLWSEGSGFDCGCENDEVRGEGSEGEEEEGPF